MSRERVAAHEKSKKQKQEKTKVSQGREETRKSVGHSGARQRGCGESAAKGRRHTERKTKEDKGGMGKQHAERRRERERERETPKVEHFLSLLFFRESLALYMFECAFFLFFVFSHPVCCCVYWYEIYISILLESSMSVGLLSMSLIIDAIPLRYSWQP